MTIRFLVVSQYWEPAQLAGGARSTARAVAALGDLTETWVLTGDRDVGDPRPWAEVDGGPLDASVWLRRGDLRVRYQPWDRGAGRRIQRAVDEVEPDVIYLASLFAPGSLAVLWRRVVGQIRCPVVVAPEGELHPGALAHHRGRKRAVLSLLRLAGVGRRVRWRAADGDEATQIRGLFGPGAEVAIAPDLHGPPTAGRPRSTGPKVPGHARIAFVGSIVPKKGLHRALELLWPSRSQVSLGIYGPVVDRAEWARCQEVLDRCGPEVAWRAHGAISHEQVAGVLAAADLLILPTLGENYGYVIAEALEVGCPVLISDQTPWHGLDEDGCGWELPLDPAEPWRERIAEVVAWDDGQRHRVRTAALARGVRARRSAEADRKAWYHLIESARASTMRR